MAIQAFRKSLLNCLLDAIHFKVRQDHRIINKATYSVLGINLQGQKEILGIWIGENESAILGLSVCNELKNRGVEDILIACKDGLKGFSEAITAVLPKTEIQLCVIHQVRNTMKYVSSKDQKIVIADLKKVYQALTLDEAEQNFLEFCETWGKKYPIVIQSWENNWDELTTYFKYPYEIRRMIYTTNMIEEYHRQLRKFTKTKTAYPTDDFLKKMVYLVTENIAKNWSHCISQFVVYFEDRIEIDRI